RRVAPPARAYIPGLHRGGRSERDDDRYGDGAQVGRERCCEHCNDEADQWSHDFSRLRVAADMGPGWSAPAPQTSTGGGICAVRILLRCYGDYPFGQPTVRRTFPWLPNPSSDRRHRSVSSSPTTNVWSA